jgi:hypothetical protein
MRRAAHITYSWGDGGIVIFESLENRLLLATGPMLYTMR